VRLPPYGACIIQVEFLRFTGALMLDHIGLEVRSYAVSKAFYSQTLVVLGYVVVEETHGWCGFGSPGKPQFFIHEGQSPTAPVHVGFSAGDRSRVDHFHAAALAAGGRDNGPPGIRAIYHPNYYGAFVLDPDGNNIEAVCHDAE
jgi:catechol 2,3-dioxygenase-like lactoylglutathione lyase family enzyme